MRLPRHLFTTSICQSVWGWWREELNWNLVPIFIQNFRQKCQVNLESLSEVSVFGIPWNLIISQKRSTSISPVTRYKTCHFRKSIYKTKSLPLWKQGRPSTNQGWHVLMELEALIVEYKGMHFELDTCSLTCSILFDKSLNMFLLFLPEKFSNKY